MIKADDVLSALPALALKANQLLGIDVVTVLRRVGTSVSGAGDRSDDTGAIVVHTAEQHPAALVRIRLLAVVAKRVIVGLAESQHNDCRFQIDDFRLKIP
jgi:hypothetical protein